jgi:hypothetical protein
MRRRTGFPAVLRVILFVCASPNAAMGLDCEALAPVDEIESVDMERGSVAGAHDDMGPCVAVFFEGTNLEIVELLQLYVRLAIGIGAAVADCPSFAEGCFIIEAWICVFGSLFGRPSCRPCCTEGIHSGLL